MAKATTEKAEKMFETFSTTANETFKKSYERSLEMMNEMSEIGKTNLEAVAQSARITTKGFEELGTRAAAYSRDSFEKSVEAARSLTTAKSVQEAMELQANFSKTAFETYLEELNQVTGKFAALVREASEPLNSQAGKFMSVLQKSA